MSAAILIGCNLLPSLAWRDRTIRFTIARLPCPDPTMAISDYADPVAQLLTLGKCSIRGVQTWTDYQSLGISATDIPSLIRMATDDDLYASDEDAPESWVPIHAWRALGQLRAAAAVEPLMQLASESVNSESWWDWLASELPSVFALIGESILPTLSEWVSHRTESPWVRVIAVDGLIALAEQTQGNDPQNPIYQECIAVFLEELTHFAENDSIFNSFLIGALAKFQMMEAVPLIEQAFAAGKVDEMMHGNWDEIQVQLGLKSRDEVPRKSIAPQFLRYLKSLDQASSSPVGFGTVTIQQSQTKRKTKQKQQSESRRKNRKKSK